MDINREKCYEIRVRKDEKYDNMFFIGSWSRGVFCNVTCPDYPPEDKNDLVYFHNIYEALEAGLCPCKDCEPNMHANQIRMNLELSNEVNNAVNLIDEGYLNINTVESLADHLFMSGRHLRRLFQKEVGISPNKIAQYQRAFFARKLVYETDMKIADIAFASGFNSIRDFNYIFKNVFHVTPSQIRRESTINHCGTEDVMHIPYFSGFSFGVAMSQIKKYIISEIEEYDDGVYRRTFSINGISGIFSIRDIPERGELELQLYSGDKRCYMGVYHRIQRMLGLMDKQQTRVLGFDPYEVAIHEILCNRYGEDKAAELERSLIRTADLKPEINKEERLSYLYPDVNIISENLLKQIGVDEETIGTLMALNTAILDNKVALAYNQTYERFHNEMKTIEGVDERLIERIAERGLGLKKV